MTESLIVSLVPREEYERLRAALHRIAEIDNGLPGGIAWAALNPSPETAAAPAEGSEQEQTAAAPPPHPPRQTP